ncbi:MAG: hypothetical protein HY042_10295, partial [Spirochaetia bacterium]|nr:hypothetical protein [Spirochaetia bacterium]
MTAETLQKGQTSLDHRKKAGSLLEAGDTIIKEVGKKGDTEVFATYTTGLRVVYENDDFTVSASGSTDLFGVRVISQGRPGFVTTNSSDPAALRAAAVEAVETAVHAPAGEHHRIASTADNAARTMPPDAHFSLVDDNLAQMAPRRVVDYLDMLIKEVRSDARIAVDRAEFSVELIINAIVNTAGIRMSSARTLAGWFVMGMARTDSEVTSFDYDGFTVSRESDIESHMKRSARAFSTSVLSSLGPVKPDTYTGKVLLHPRAFSDLIIDFLVTNANARMHQDSMSAFKDKVGSVVTSSGLCLVEDPENSDRPQGWTPFDREGLLTSKHSIIDRGVLAFLGHNLFTASRGKAKPTGNATGGARSAPGIGFHNLEASFPEGGAVPILDTPSLYKELGTGLEVVRFSGNADPVSGRFSGVA